EDPVDGLTVYDKTAKAYSYYDGSRWLFMYNSGSQPEETVTIPGMEMSLPTNLISLVHGNWVEDTAGIIYDSGGNEYHYANNENFEFYLYAGDAVGYKLHIEYDIAAQDSLIFRDLFTENVFSVITNGS